jgi:hypothetical protein
MYAFTYVICATSSERSELDSLDLPAFSCYAASVPAAIRPKELGEDYIKRLAASAAPAAGGKDAKAAAKGAPAPAAVVIKAGEWNVLVKDPDSLPSYVAPSDPLVVGAFTVLQRVGTILPGETSGFDIKFDPSGCSNARERFRIFISGVDSSDPSAMFLTDFDVSGDSCIPAIADDDMTAVFEETEIVGSLADVGSSGSFSTYFFIACFYAEIVTFLCIFS